ncbi:hypothetical protein AHAS_Ahas09G0075500 [Arachis hypogaea]
MGLGSMDMNILPCEVVVEGRIHLVVENFHMLGWFILDGYGLGSYEGVGKKGLVSMVESYVEDMDHRYMVVVLESHKVIHHNHWMDMHHRMALLHSALVEVVAKKIDHMHMAPPTFGCPILDIHLHYSSHHLQHSCNHTHSQNENS